MQHQAITAESSSDNPRVTESGQFDSVGTSSPLAFVRLIGHRGRRAAIATAAMLGLCLLLTSGLPQVVRDWIHQRTVYQWKESIELQPGPPPWLLGGRQAILREALPALQSFEGGSAIDLDLEAIHRAFKNVRWVQSVERIERSYPNHVKVALRYREPVAVVRFPSEFDRANRPKSESLDFVIDGEGVILERRPGVRQLDQDLLSDLLTLRRFEKPINDELGAIWSEVTTEYPELTQPADEVLAAAALAAFLRNASAQDGWPQTPMNQSIRIAQIEPPQGRGPGPGPDLFALCVPEGEGHLFWLYWSSSSVDAPDDSLTAAQKWEIFREWVRLGGYDPQSHPDQTYYETHYVRYHNNGLYWEKN